MASFNITSVSFAVAVAVGCVTTVAIIYYNWRKCKNWNKVGTVRKLFLHPVKSMRGVDMPYISCTKKGVCEQNGSMFDRSFLVVRPDGTMLTARKEPTLVTVHTELGDGHIILSADGMSPIKVDFPEEHKTSNALVCKVWGNETIGLDCGDAVAAWLTNYLKTDYRLVYHPRQFKGRDICDAFAEKRPLLKSNTSAGKLLYHDCAPCALLSEASIEDLNTRLDNKVSVRNFRPNILVGGCKPYEEDNWRYLKIGTAEFEYVINTSRCVFTTIHPETGIKDPTGNPLATLKTYRLCKPEDRKLFDTSPLFGLSLATIKEGMISLGDDVYAC